MKTHVIDLSKLVDEKYTDSISGRSFGEQFAKNEKILQKLESGEQIILKIDSNIVKAINDSFIKGFFSAIFEKKYTYQKLKNQIKFDTDNLNFVSLFEKNWLILDRICNG